MSTQAGLDRFEQESTEPVQERIADVEEPEPATEPEQSDETGILNGEERGRVRHHVEHGRFETMIRSAGISGPSIMHHVRETIGETVGAFLKFAESGDFEEIHGIGPDKAARFEAMVPLVREGYEAADPFEFDDYGPTTDEPIEWIAPAEVEALHESGGELVDEREIPHSGLSLSDITDWPYINRERDRPDRREAEAKKIAELEGLTQSPDTGGKKRAVTDGGEIVEEWGSYESGDTVKLIENVAVGLNTSPNILEAEVSSSGKSVMVPEDADSIHGSRRLDAETIFSGESEYRDSSGYELYTPGRYRNKQRSNYGPGPQTGANEVSEVDDLSKPTHWPEGDEVDDAPDECPECGAVGPWHDVGKPRCEHCGVTVYPDEDEGEADEEGSQ
ncbi:hypothetical protein HSRCO_0757 [Halanaeroarchaeum sp. HSR-CO]|uniref:hypothetical protein n=1 Tax=Halanaeroarchaeum sp. HSR-CO TaxID=2866382 RepID=UPI00217E7FA7|nr:hypothetical protein [Halanaeroarchaeum sp. HSR-CO]UWG47051.1 hypothetical protein HSRCO_0757 [Halanaeroarchaeum sp. HSR-CO]